MTVSELINKLKECAPNARVKAKDSDYGYYDITEVESDGERVELS